MHAPTVRTCRARPLFLAAGVLSMTMAGCSDPESAVGLSESDPGARFRAIRQAQAERDRSAVPDLIRLLESDDPAERFFASAALKDITGRDFGYDPTATRPDRATAARRWAEWYAHSDAGRANTRSEGIPGSTVDPDSSASPREPNS